MSSITQIINVYLLALVYWKSNSESQNTILDVWDVLLSVVRYPLLFFYYILGNLSIWFFYFTSFWNLIKSNNFLTYYYLQQEENVEVEPKFCPREWLRVRSFSVGYPWQIYVVILSYEHYLGSRMKFLFNFKREIVTKYLTLTNLLEKLSL